MKKATIAMLLSVLAVCGGLAAKPYSRLVCILLVIGGLISFFISFLWIVRRQGGKICPNCGHRFYVYASQIRWVHAGMYPCPKCGTLVRVDHISPQ